MSSANLESRVTALETQYAEILKLVQKPSAKDAWREVVGMFATDPQIEDLHQETQRIREADRIATRDASQGDS